MKVFIVFSFTDDMLGTILGVGNIVRVRQSRFLLSWGLTLSKGQSRSNYINVMTAGGD